MRPINLIILLLYPHQKILLHHLLDITDNYTIRGFTLGDVASSDPVFSEDQTREAPRQVNVATSPSLEVLVNFLNEIAHSEMMNLIGHPRHLATIAAHLKMA